MKLHRLQPFALGIAAAFVAVPCFAATTNVKHPQNSAWKQSSASHLDLMSANASLIHPLNSKNARQGQTIAAKLTTSVKNAGATDIPKGTVLMGTVQQVENSSDGGPAKLSVLFDRARLKSGQTVPVKVTLLSVYPPAPQYGMGGPAEYMPTQSHPVANDQKVTQEPGVIRHVAMRSAVQSHVSGTFTSQDHNIDLHRGTRLQLAIAREMAPTSMSSGM